MDNNLIVMYENNNLVIQTGSIISEGEISIIDGNDSQHILFSKSMVNTDFLNIKIDLPQGKHHLQIITSNNKLVKEINV